jgi:hypothetical protein
MSLDVITDDFLKGLFPPGRDNEFFEALYGGAEAGAFDITLHTNGFDSASNMLHLEFRLTERPGMCMACNLTYGLPEVFKRHPVINARGIAEEIEKKLQPEWRVEEWHIGSTIAADPKVNSIPFLIKLARADA